MRFLNRAGKSRQPCVVHAMPLMHMAGARMAKPLQPQRFLAMKPAFSMQSAGIPSSGIRTVSRGEIHPASC
jgi:hypothetical protein